MKCLPILNMHFMPDIGVLMYDVVGMDQQGEPIAGTMFMRYCGDLLQ